MKRNNGGLLLLAGVGAAAYWASRQPGGFQGTLSRFQQGLKDIQAGQDPMKVGKRFVGGRDEEPAGVYTDEAMSYGSSDMSADRDQSVTTSTGSYNEPYRDQVSSAI